MKYLTLLPIIALSSNALAAGPKSTDQAAIEANYAAITRAFQHRDTDAYTRMLAPDYTLALGPKTTVSRDQVMADFKRQTSVAKHVRWKRTITQFHLDAGLAVADVQGHFQADVAGPDGKSHKQVLDALTRDTWVGAGKQWKLQHSELLKFSMSLDGKPVQGR